MLDPRQTSCAPVQMLQLALHGHYIVFCIRTSAVPSLKLSKTRL